ncbi:hypothetical protein K450DRAFT_242137, partial [Umbelopsis ramanniana AG]
NELVYACQHPVYYIFEINGVSHGAKSVITAITLGLKPYLSKHSFRVFLVSHRLQRINYWQHLCNQFSQAYPTSTLDFS